MKKGTQTAIGIVATIIALAIIALCFIGCFLYYLSIAIPNGHRMSTKISRDFIYEESIWISDDGNFYIINMKQENGKHNSFAYIKAADGSFVKCSVSVNTGAGVNISTTGEEKDEKIAYLDSISVENNKWKLKRFRLQHYDKYDELKLKIPNRLTLTRYDVGEKLDSLPFKLD